MRSLTWHIRTSGRPQNLFASGRYFLEDRFESLRVACFFLNSERGDFLQVLSTVAYVPSSHHDPSLQRGYSVFECGYTACSIVYVRKLLILSGHMALGCICVRVLTDVWVNRRACRQHQRFRRGWSHFFQTCRRKTDKFIAKKAHLSHARHTPMATMKRAADAASGGMPQRMTVLPTEVFAVVASKCCVLAPLVLSGSSKANHTTVKEAADMLLLEMTNAATTRDWSVGRS